MGPVDDGVVFVTELFPGLSGRAFNFPNRNRLIAGTEFESMSLEDIVLMETLAATPRPRVIFSGKEVFKLQFESGEFDMVVRDLDTRTCQLFEVKHSKERVDGQFRHLVDADLLSRTEKVFGKVSSRVVLYRGSDFAHPSGVSYRNVESYLKALSKPR